MAKQKRKVSMPAGIRNKMIAATSMLMVSCIMMVSSTYAWFTLSTAPEVKNISTTVAGNGSLEIALMPTDGALANIKAGNAGNYAGGTVAATTANISWGNLISLSGGTADTDYYGLSEVTLLPASLDLTDSAHPLKTAVYGNDGRVASLDNQNSELRIWDKSKFVALTTENGYGVRAIGTAEESVFSTYGYVVDFAVRLNTTGEKETLGNLLLQSKAVDRIYSGENAESSEAATMGGGSYMEFNNVAAGFKMKELLDAVRITFVADYGNSATTAQQTKLGTARLDTSNVSEKVTAEGASTGKLPLLLYKENPTNSGTETLDTSNILLKGLKKNQARQISAIVWLDGQTLKNSSVAANAINSMEGVLNLQFATDIELHPASNSALKNPTN